MKGFTLVEIAIVLAILALLVGGMLVPISAQVDQQKIVETQKSLDLIKESLAGFAVANGYLPCPAKSATDGNEDRSAGLCNRRVGFVPWVTLGTPLLDAWGHLFKYSVSPAYSSAVTPISLTSLADITIRTRDSTGTLVNLSNANGIPVVVISHGKNGFGATNAQGVAQMAPPSSNVDETTNATGSTLFVARTQVSDQGSTNGAFDDTVDWVSPYVLVDRLVTSGRLP